MSRLSGASFDTGAPGGRAEGEKMRRKSPTISLYILAAMDAGAGEAATGAGGAAGAAAGAGTNGS